MTTELKSTAEPKPTAAHTPGPWTVGGKTWIHGAPHDLPLASAYPGHYTETLAAEPSFKREVVARSPEEVEANARLIAAAPDLLDALKALVAGVERDDNPSDEGHYAYSDEMHAAHAAIAKATGGAQ